MSPPRKRVKTSRSTAAVPVRSMHMLRRRSLPIQRRSSTPQRNQRPTRNAQPDPVVNQPQTVNAHTRDMVPNEQSGMDHSQAPTTGQGAVGYFGGSRSNTNNVQAAPKRNFTPSNARKEGGTGVSHLSNDRSGGKNSSTDQGRAKTTHPSSPNEDDSLQVTADYDKFEIMHPNLHSGLPSNREIANPEPVQDEQSILALTLRPTNEDVARDTCNDRHDNGDTPQVDEHQNNEQTHAIALRPVEDTDELHQDSTEHTIRSMNEKDHTFVKYGKLMSRMKSTVTWDRMLACITLSGRPAMTAEQYEFFKSCLHAANPVVNLATYKTTTTSHWNDYIRKSFPKSFIYHIRHTNKHSQPGSTIAAINNEKSDAADCVRVVLPSEWAKLDVQSLSFYDDVFDGRSNTSIFDIENAPIVRNRKAVTGATLTFWAFYNDAVCPCREGDILQFHCNKEVTGSMENIPDDSHVSANGSGKDPRNAELCVKGVLGISWCVHKNACLPTLRMDRNLHSLTDDEKNVLQVLHGTKPRPLTGLRPRSDDKQAKRRTKSHIRKQKTLYESRHPGGLLLYPGDYCALIRPSTNVRNDKICLFVASQIGEATGEALERLVWVSPNAEHGNSYIVVHTEAVVRNLPYWIGGDRSKPTFPNGLTPNKGKLSNGLNYVVYRLALYTDGFKQHKSLSDSRSVDGCYMLPLGPSMESRTSSTQCRVISLTPHGHSPNAVLGIIHEDLITGASKGFDSFDPFGRPVKIFLDVVGIFGDYPALTATADLRGHNATAFCTFCTFKENTTSESGSRLHSTVLHSRRLCATRTDHRRSLIRPSLDEDMLKAIGFKKRETTEADRLPTVRLAADLCKHPCLLKDENGREFMPNGFDSVQSMAAAPDHLLTGIIQYTLEACFLSLPSNKERELIELRMIVDARDNGMREQGRFLKLRDNKFEGLRSLSMSTKICLLLTSVRPFNEQFAMTGRVVFRLPEILQMFVSLVYYVPNVDVEGPPAAEYLHEEGYINIRGQQLKTITEFLHTSTEVFKNNAEIGALLNKPNAHRALELCVHTICNFGHALNCSEMVLEMTHRKFKNWLECNTHSDSHISGMERAICTDWQGRVAAMYHVLCHGSVTERDCASRSLRRLLLGEEALEIDEQSTPGKKLIEDFHEALKHAMAQPVLKEMDLSNKLNISRDRKWAWEVDRTKQVVKVDGTMLLGRQKLADWYTTAFPDRTVSLTWHNKASYMCTSQYGRRRRSYPHHTLVPGTAVSVITPKRQQYGQDIVLEEEDRRNGRMQFFTVYGILGTYHGDVWCVVRQLKDDGKHFRVVTQSQTSVLRMGGRARRVAIIHACDDSCTVDVQTRKVRHGQDVRDGGPVEVVARFDGYPPHLG